MFYFVGYVILQIPLLYKFVLFNVAFSFFYLGFLVFFPLGQNPILRLMTGFLTGLFIDLFSNTPGLHASVCTFIMFFRDTWLRLILEFEEGVLDMNIYVLKVKGVFLYALPLIFIHHLMIFWINHGSGMGVFLIFDRILASTIFSLTSILLINMVISIKPSRI
ncbi:MAG: hypothetical protein CMB82_12060 [Flammeovirgaceae bacterium]|nr:hypothetical protein [Flammeovirgaceae bacterium]